MGTAGVKNADVNGIRAACALRSFLSREPAAAAPEPLGAKENGEGEEPPG